MAKKRTPPPSGGGGGTPQGSGVVRVMFEAPATWVAQLDAVAEGLGLSRSAYIRQAVTLRMQADEAGGG